MASLASDEIYDALLDDELFARLPSRLAEAFGGRSTLIHWHHSDGTASILSHSGYFTDEQLADYAAEFAAIDPWAAAASRFQKPNEALDLETILPVAEFERSDFYNGYVKAMGDDTARCMGVRVANAHGQGMIAIQRGRTQRGFDPQQVAAVSEISVHLRRVLAIRGRLASVEQRLSAAHAMLDGLSTAVLLVNRQAVLVEANLSAQALLARGSFLTLTGRVLTSTTTSGARRLERAIARACDSTTPTASAVLLERPGEQIVLSVVPIKAPNGAQQAMLLAQSAQSCVDPIVRLRELYQLSEAQADVALRLARGELVTQIAAARGVSVETVRVQLKMLAAKLGCRGQVEIAATVTRALTLV